MDLYETLTHDVYWLAIRHYEDIFWVLPPKNWGPKTTYFRRLRNLKESLRANVFGEEHDIDDQETALETTKGPLHHPKIS